MQTMIGKTGSAVVKVGKLVTPIELIADGMVTLLAVIRETPTNETGRSSRWLINNPFYDLEDQQPFFDFRNDLA